MTETLEYTVLKKANGVELRRYPAHIRAEVEVPGSTYQQAIYQGFRVLANYIFGDNIDTSKIAMTSPVQVSNSKKIPMTKPVTVRRDGSFSVAFIMPSEYTFETLPKPVDHKVRLTAVDSEVRAALRFSGYFSENKLSEEKKKKIPLFIRLIQVEEFLYYVQYFHDPDEQIQAHLRYMIKCIEENLPYMGFFDPIYSPERPFLL